MSSRRHPSRPILLPLVTLATNVLCRKCGARRLMLVLLLAVTALAWVYIANRLNVGVLLSASPNEELDVQPPRRDAEEASKDAERPGQGRVASLTGNLSGADAKDEDPTLKKSRRDNAMNRTNGRGGMPPVENKTGSEGNYTVTGHQPDKAIVGGEGKLGRIGAEDKEKLAPNGKLPHWVEVVVDTKHHRANGSLDSIKPAQGGLQVKSQGSRGKELLREKVESAREMWGKKPPSSEVGGGLSKRGNDTESATFLGQVKGLKEAMRKHSFNLVLNEPAACRDSAGRRKDVFLLILITTTHEARARRQAIRESWASLGELMGRTIVRLFLLGATPNATLNELVRHESAQHHDLLMEDFVDSYKNLSLKTLMGMKWMITQCPQASYVMKTDHDMYIGLHNLVSLLTREDTPTERFVTGYVFKYMPPMRDSEDKNYMPWNLFRDTKYPPYCAGAGYVMSGDVLPLVYTRTFVITKFIHIEDVMVGICLNALGIKPVHNDAFWHNGIPFVPYSFCAYRKLISMHGVTSEIMTQIWKEEQSYHADSDCP